MKLSATFNVTVPADGDSTVRAFHVKDEVSGFHEEVVMLKNDWELLGRPGQVEVVIKAVAGTEIPDPAATDEED